MASVNFVRKNDGPSDALNAVEWLLTTGNGGFAMGTASGVPSRRYHGLLVASLRPPVQRVMALNMLAETVVLSGGERVALWRARFRPGDVHPKAGGGTEARLVKFEKGQSVKWTYEVPVGNGGVGGGVVTVEKHLALVAGANRAVVKYVVRGGGKEGVGLEVRPLTALRDFHALVLRDLAGGGMRVDDGPTRLGVQSPEGSVVIEGKGCGARRDEQWWYNFQYNHERDRGYDFLEDLFSPGAFEATFTGGSGGEMSLLISAGGAASSGANAELTEDPEVISTQRRKRIDAMASAARAQLGKGASSKGVESWLESLVGAADDFVVRRRVGGGASEGGEGSRATIIAGYPWFADWGRDSMISLPGLLLSCGRFAEAAEVLRTFAGARRNGLVPNLFDDYTGDAHYNTVDASLWFIHASCEYLRVSGDRELFFAELLPACRDIVDWYRKGTEFNIGVDASDGLVFAGNEQTQLTWMDAKRDGVTFTPRQGKAVEVNALWYHGLRSLIEACGTGSVGASGAKAVVAKVGGAIGSVVRGAAGVVGVGGGGIGSAGKAYEVDQAWLKGVQEMADRAGESLRTKFFGAAGGGMYDTLAPDGQGGWIGVWEVRPNQLLAVSLRHGALEKAQQRAVVNLCRRELVTPCGMRTLARGDGRYRGRFRGRMFDRDAAYHNGTAWPWLLGPMAEAVLRAGDFSASACDEAEGLLAGVLRHAEADCLGQIAEVFDGDHEPPMVQVAGGCPAQAWSVAEPMRVLMLIARARAGMKV